jgi:hypothetical protein
MHFCGSLYTNLWFFLSCSVVLIHTISAEIMFKCYELYICKNGSTPINMKNFSVGYTLLKKSCLKYTDLYININGSTLITLQNFLQMQRVTKNLEGLPNKNSNMSRYFFVKVSHQS